jgi:branched-chain amino acid transport system permease protein
MSEWSEIVQVALAGLTNGSVYALVALGFSLVFAVSGFLNLVQGEYVVIGGLVTIALTERQHVPLVPAILAAILVSCAFGYAVQRLSLSPNRKLSPDAALIVTLGAAFIARGGAMVVFGKQPLALPSFSGERPVIWGDVTVDTQSFWIVGTLVIAFGSLWWFFHKTYAGTAMRACAENPIGARLIGIDLKRMATVAFVTSALLGGIAGVVVAPLNFVTYDEGLGIGIKGFIAAIVGGLGSYPGAVLGGLILGLGESVGAAYISSQFKDAIVFVGLLIALLLRPNGLLGARR